MFEALRHAKWFGTSFPASITSQFSFRIARLDTSSGRVLDPQLRVFKKNMAASDADDSGCWGSQSVRTFKNRAVSTQAQPPYASIISTNWDAILGSFWRQKDLETPSVAAKAVFFAEASHDRTSSGYSIGILGRVRPGRLRLPGRQ